jgi:hypothetical protein
MRVVEGELLQEAEEDVGVRLGAAGLYALEVACPALVLLGVRMVLYLL